MGPIPIPEKGLILEGASTSASPDTVAGAETKSQVMRLDLANDVLEDIMRASKMGKDVHMSFGKNVVRLLLYCCITIGIQPYLLTIPNRCH